VSLCLIRGPIPGGRLGICSLWKPAGMECLEAVVRIFLKDNSPWEEEEGGGREENSCSVSSKYFSQLARLKQ